VLRPDVAECSTWEAELLDYLRLPGRAPVLVRGDLSAATMHAVDLAGDEQALCRAADAVVAVSEFAAGDLASAYGIARPSVIANGVDRDRFTPHGHRVPSSGWQVDLDLGGEVIGRRRLPDLVATDPAWSSYFHGAGGTPRLVWVGKFTQMKGFDRLQQLAHRLAGRARLLIVLGHGQVHYPVDLPPEVLICQDLTAEDVPAVYRAADYLLSTSRWEGYGLAIAEALACGTPVLLPAELAVAGELITDQSTGACYTSVGHLLYLLASPPRYDLVSLHFGNLEIEQLLPARWRTLGADVPPVVVHVHALEPTLFTRHVPDPKLHAAAVQAINHAAGLVYFGRYARSSLTQRTPAVARLPHAVIWAWPCTASATPPARSMTDLGLLLMTRTQCYRSLRPGRRQRTRPLYPRHAAEQRRRIALPVVNPWTTPVDDRASVIGGDFERRRVTHAVEDHQIPVGPLRRPVIDRRAGSDTILIAPDKKSRRRDPAHRVEHGSPPDEHQRHQRGIHRDRVPQSRRLDRRHLVPHEIDDFRRRSRQVTARIPFAARDRCGIGQQQRQLLSEDAPPRNAEQHTGDRRDDGQPRPSEGLPHARLAVAQRGRKCRHHQHEPVNPFGCLVGEQQRNHPARRPAVNNDPIQLECVDEIAQEQRVGFDARRAPVQQRGVAGDRAEPV
jgi:hypothetical protein